MFNFLKLSTVVCCSVQPLVLLTALVLQSPDLQFGPIWWGNNFNQKVFGFGKSKSEDKTSSETIFGINFDIGCVQNYN